MTNDKRKKKGFTLIEMVVVIAIIAILSSIAVPQALKAINKAKAQADIANAKTIANCIIQGTADGETGTSSSWTQVASYNANGSVTVQSPSWLGTYMQPIPKPKMNNNYVFYYCVNGDTIQVGVGDTGSGHDIFQLYPSVLSTSSTTSTASPYFGY